MKRTLARLLTPILAGLLALLAVLSISSVAFAADPVPETPAATRLMGIAFDVLALVVGAFVMWGMHRLLALFEKKSGIDIPDKQEALLDAWVKKGIVYAEEKSRGKIKSLGEKLKGPEKLEIAAKFALDMAESRGLVKWTKDKIAAKVEASLGEHRLNGGKPSLDKDSSPDAPAVTN